MVAVAECLEEDEGGQRVARLTGRFTLARLGSLPGRLDELCPAPNIVDLSGIERIDTVGAWIVYKLARDHQASLRGASDEAIRLIEQVKVADVPMRTRPEAQTPIARVVGEIGGAVVLAGQTTIGMISFLGAILIACWNTLRHPSRLRIDAVVQRFELVGVKALGIVGLMSFLIGVVIAQQGAVQLAQFGAESLTVNLIGRLTTRELGVLMTAIMVAGRSGSAFAAQIGTMKLTEEIDAMRTIGVSPVEALVLPRLIATVVMMPLLGFYATVVAMLGGGIFCWLSLEIPPDAYLSRLRDVIPITDVWVGLVKAPVFGLFIALTGCFQGMQVSGNAEEVGLKTTAAVVQAIFMVIVLDAFFAVFFSEIGWV